MVSEMFVFYPGWAQAPVGANKIPGNHRFYTDPGEALNAVYLMNMEMHIQLRNSKTCLAFTRNNKQTNLIYDQYLLSTEEK